DPARGVHGHDEWWTVGLRGRRREGRLRRLGHLRHELGHQQHGPDALRPLRRPPSHVRDVRLPRPGHAERRDHPVAGDEVDELAPIDTVTVVDPATLKVDLKAPSAPFLSVLVDRSGMMLSRKAVEAGGADFTRKAFKAGSGPFILTEAVKDDHYTFQKNPDWWGKASNGDKLPYLETVIIKPITDGDVRLTNVRTGQVQATNAVTGKDVPTVKSDSTLVYQEIAGIGYNSLVPNRAPTFIFNEKRYVQAVSYAMDRNELLNKGPAQGVGVVAYGPIAPSHFAYDASFKPFEKPDVAKAKQLVADVGKGPLKF